jgi:hypothetical protein
VQSTLIEKLVAGGVILMILLGIFFYYYLKEKKPRKVAPPAGELPKSPAKTEKPSPPRSKKAA